MGGVEEPPQGRPRYTAPEAISPQHRLDTFDCGRSALNDWLRKRALKNEGRASRTYVVTATGGEEGRAVVAYYTLAAGAVRLEDLPRPLGRNMPNPVPVMVLGRLVVDRRHQGAGLGSGMLREAMQRVLGASRQVGARAVVVHALDDEAVTFYTQFGFRASPAGGRTLFLPVETIAASL
jgi:GNAT superfamily N-acetyltransferase